MFSRGYAPGKIQKEPSYLYLLHTWEGHDTSALLTKHGRPVSRAKMISSSIFLFVDLIVGLGGREGCQGGLQFMQRSVTAD